MEVVMATKVLRLVIGATALISGITIMALLSCDKKHAVNPEPIEKRIGSILVILSPPRIHLPSQEAIDTAMIMIAVVDSDGVGMSSIKPNVTRHPDIGVIIQPDSTDSLGMTTATFITEPGVYDSVWISASAQNVSGAALLVIDQLSMSIGRIIISPDSINLVADGADTASIYADILDSDGDPVWDGTIVYFAHMGQGYLAAPQMTTTGGHVRNKITAPPNIMLNHHSDTVFVSDFPGVSATVTDTAIVNYVAGPVSHLEFVYPESTVTLLAGSGDTCSVVVQATDVNGNLISDGTQISFKNTNPLSSLFPQDTGTVNGLFRAVYLVGSGTGDDNVTAWALNPANVNDTIKTPHPVVFRCIGSNAYDSISVSAERDSIEAGGDSTLILATIHRFFADPFGEDMVAFDITWPPDSIGGPSFDRQRQVHHDTVMANSNGQAMLHLYSGNRAGITVSIRACGVISPGDTTTPLCDERPLVTITAGEPDHINFAFSSNGEAEPPARFVQVGVIIGDRYSNPVDNGIPVYYHLVPPDLGYIDSVTYTGYSNPHHPDSTRGVAYASIYYGCLSTFLPFQVEAAVGNSVVLVDTSSICLLPIWQGEIDLLPNPGSLYTVDSTCASRDTSWVTATLTDGGGCPIKNGIISFAAPLAGAIIGQAIDTTDIDGHAGAMFMIRGCDIPCSDIGCAVNATVKATLIQKPSVWSVTNILCSRPLNRMR
jgi:hypothetical protein